MYNVDIYAGPEGSKQPLWNPNIPSQNVLEVEKGMIGAWSPSVILRDEDCKHLITEFEKQEKHAVGVDGYADAASKPGSFRTNAWAPELARKLNPAFDGLVPGVLRGDGRTLHWGTGRGGIHIDTPFDCNRNYHLIGSTPWMRFMRYSRGGQHTPHYDAPFHNEKERYITLYSWVLFLNTIRPYDGGSFQFVHDEWSGWKGEYRTQTGYVHPQDRPEGHLKDWTYMARRDEIASRVQPYGGALLIFPHWKCHQVEEYFGKQHRYIIRGDIAYGYI